MHHLGEWAAVHALDTVLKNGQVPGWMCLAELSRRVLSFEHVDLNVVVVKVTYLTEKLHHTTVRIEEESNDVNLVGIYSLDLRLWP